jgi:hypothetical protein
MCEGFIIFSMKWICPRGSSLYSRYVRGVHLYIVDMSGGSSRTYPLYRDEPLGHIHYIEMNPADISTILRWTLTTYPLYRDKPLRHIYYIEMNPSNISTIRVSSLYSGYFRGVHYILYIVDMSEGFISIEWICPRGSSLYSGYVRGVHYILYKVDMSAGFISI